jgi:flagellar assembly protein FliH
LPKILKASTVYIDNDNIVSIKADFIPPILHEPILPEEFEEEALVDETPPEELAKNILEEAKREAEIIVSTANIAADKQLAEAKSRADLLINEAKIRMDEESERLYEESKADGYQHGMDIAQTEGEAIKNDAKTILEEAIKEKEETLAAIEPDTINLIISIVDKLVAGAVSANPGVITALIRQGLSETNIMGKVVIKVSKEDYESVVEQKNELLTAAGAATDFEIVQDISLDKTEAVIETELGGIDVSLGHQLQGLKENLVLLLEQE